MVYSRGTIRNVYVLRYVFSRYEYTFFLRFYVPPGLKLPRLGSPKSGPISHYDNLRRDETKIFLHQLRSYTYLYAWLNPVPLYRWHFTTAEDIAQLAPMYPLDRDGLDDAITILRGHPFPPGVRTDV